MASDTPTDSPAEPRPCSPCRGTGKVISNLGGSPSEIECPWCEGTGTFIPEHDAQARKRSEAGPESPVAQETGA